MHILELIRSIVRETFPNYTFLGLYKYRVLAVVSHKISIQAVSSVPGLPHMLFVDSASGVPGCYGDPASGTEVLVGFVGGSPNEPIILHLLEPSSRLPDGLTLDAKLESTVEIGKSTMSALATMVGVARVGDSVDPNTFKIMPNDSTVKVPRLPTP